jgi:hypothetical protein
MFSGIDAYSPRFWSGLVQSNGSVRICQRHEGQIFDNFKIFLGFTESSVIQSRAFERGFIRCIGTGPGEPRKGPWISEVPHGLSHWRFILICSLSIWYFKFKSTILREVSACPQVPKQYCSALQYFFWRPCCRYIKIKRQWLSTWGTSEIHGPFLDSPGPVPMHRMNPLSKALLCTTLNSVNPVLNPSIDTILCVFIT